MKKYINLLLIPIILVTLKNGTIREFEADRFWFQVQEFGCATILLYKRNKSKPFIQFNCDSVTSVEKKLK